jgi:hypothetical protein
MSRADDFHDATREGLVQPGQGDPASTERRRPKHRADERDVLGGGHPEQAPRGGTDPADLDDELAGAPAEAPEGSDGQDDGSLA